MIFTEGGGSLLVRRELFDELMNKEMTRFEFLKFVAVMITSLIGVTNLLELSRPLNNYQSNPTPTPSSGFGSTKFGK